MSRPSGVRVAMFTYATQPRGGVLHALALAEALHDRGHEVMLFALAEGGGSFVREPRCPYHLFPVNVPRTDTLGYARASIAAYVAAWEPATPAFDIYHAHDSISGNALATLVERGTISQFVRTVHHLDDFGNAELEALQARAIRAAGACLVVSGLWRERLRAAYDREAAVVPNGVDSARFTPVPEVERAALRRGLGYADGPLFVTVGGIEMRKNTLATLEAFALVRRERPAARLVIAGGASVLNHSAYRHAFDARVGDLGLAIGREITLTGVIDDAAIVTLLRAAHALVFPSLVEGFGLVILEALACGTPVVTSAIRPFTDFLSPDDAILIDPRDPAALARAMLATLDPAVAASARRGPDLARRFSWDASAGAHISAYMTFLAAGHPVPVHA